MPRNRRRLGNPLTPFSGLVHGEPALPYARRILRTTREAQRLRQVDIARAMGLSERFVRAFEDGTAQWFWSDVLHYAEVLGLDALALLPPDPAAQLPANPHDPLVQLVKQLRACPPALVQSLGETLAYFRATPSTPCPLPTAQRP